MVWVSMAEQLLEVKSFSMSVLQWISQLHLFKVVQKRVQESRTVCECPIFKMQRIYMHSNEHFEVFTTVLAPQGRYRYRAEAEKMVVVHRYRPHWPDELELSPGDVILVLSKYEEGRWFGRLQNGQRGYFPASCVMELGQANLPPKGLRRSLSLRTTPGDSERSRYGNGHILQAFMKGSRGGGEGVGLDKGQGERQGPFLVRSSRVPLPQPVASQPQAHRSPNLLCRILSKCRKKIECQGATNGAFEGD